MAKDLNEMFQGSNNLEPDRLIKFFVDRELLSRVESSMALENGNLTEATKLTNYASCYKGLQEDIEQFIIMRQKEREKNNGQ